MSGLIKMAVFSLLLYSVVLVEIAKENPASHSYEVGKARTISLNCQIISDIFIC